MEALSLVLTLVPHQRVQHVSSYANLLAKDLSLPQTVAMM